MSYFHSHWSRSRQAQHPVEAVAIVNTLHICWNYCHVGIARRTWWCVECRGRVERGCEKLRVQRRLEIFFWGRSAISCKEISVAEWAYSCTSLCISRQCIVCDEKFCFPASPNLTFKLSPLGNKMTIAVPIISIDEGINHFNFNCLCSKALTNFR